MKGKKSDLADLVRSCLRARESGKRAYARADRLLDELASSVEIGEPIVLNESGKKAILKDQFADKSIVWKPCGVRRFELEIIEP